MAILGQRKDTLFLRFKGYAKMLELLKKKPPPKYNLTHMSPAELGRMVNAATFAIIDREKACLRSSMLLWWLLNNNDIDAILCRGLRFDKQKLEGHAWVEVDGLTVNDRKHIADEYHNVTREIWSQ
ncbi:hypothetical protein C8024_11970 [Sphingopyxis sp. BSNA05]|uniref:lasso peptide biosynthesis B2 protein n=1 Tax=Sphingopyxis sp. BSNA05 TaxID=1236614 RepID=UPI0015648555|nr:lasso peptide biosynthesis B2 protein [Sphingopyxis sp. BSNA05]NRD90022.1 hypothetical protein [Sphingopyxis sp. BSNA05]